jgi:amidophosphoribosyltransferase
LIVVDDSIVRGTTTRQIVAMLREAGASEVHIRITSPPIRWPCFYGIDMSTRTELVAADLAVDEIRSYVGADTLGYISLEGLLACEREPSHYCRACFTGEYPVAVDPQAGKLALEHLHRIAGAGA